MPPPFTNADVSALQYDQTIRLVSIGNLIAMCKQLSEGTRELVVSHPGPDSCTIIFHHRNSDNREVKDPITLPCVPQRSGNPVDTYVLLVRKDFRQDTCSEELSDRFDHLFADCRVMGHDEDLEQWTPKPR